jgi:hypothetical protein
VKSAKSPVHCNKGSKDLRWRASIAIAAVCDLQAKRQSKYVSKCCNACVRDRSYNSDFLLAASYCTQLLAAGVNGQAETSMRLQLRGFSRKKN